MFIDPRTPTAWPSPKTAYETDALRFCYDWLSGQPEFILHTSGSTGVPKPIRLTRAQMQASAQLTGQTLDLRAGDAALVCLNIRYVAGIMMLVRSLELGLPMTIIEPTSNPLETVEVEQKIPFAFTALVPMQLQTILDATPEKVEILNQMKAILVGGAATSLSLEQVIQVIEAPVYATYGMTETVSHIALRRLNGSSKSPYFMALTGVTLGTDTRGCLHVTSAATNFDCVQTNDVVELVDERNFRLLGRADRIINSGGVKIQPEVIEDIVQNVLSTVYQHVPRLFVAGIPDERLGQRVVLVVETTAKSGKSTAIRSDDWNEIQEKIRAKLGAYATPKELYLRDRFTETPTGKIDQKATIAQIH